MTVPGAQLTPAMRQADVPQPTGVRHGRSLAKIRPATALPGQVFLCYVREDADEADRLQQVLERAGIKVWRDNERIRPGQGWRLEVRKAITTPRLAFIACFSERSRSKASSYQNEELRLAIDQMRLLQPGVPWLIPVRFDPCSLPEFDLGGGRLLASLHTADLFGSNYEFQAERLVQAIRQLLADEPASVTDRASEPGTTKSP